MNLVQFSKDLEVPTWLRKFVVGVNIVTFTRPNFPYVPFLIISRKMEPALRGFVSYDKGLPFISEDVPVAFWPYFILHELIEFEELNGVGGRCLEALKRELAFVPKEILQRYIAYRRKFFAGLVTYYALSKHGANAEFKAEIAASLKYLTGLSGIRRESTVSV